MNSKLRYVLEALRIESCGLLRENYFGGLEIVQMARKTLDAPANLGLQVVGQLEILGPDGKFHFSLLQVWVTSSGSAPIARSRGATFIIPLPQHPVNQL